MMADQEEEIVPVEIAPVDVEVMISLKDELDLKIWKAMNRLFTPVGYSSAPNPPEDHDSLQNEFITKLTHMYNYQFNLANSTTFKDLFVANLRDDLQFKELIMSVFQKELRQLINNSTYDYTNKDQ